MSRVEAEKGNGGFHEKVYLCFNLFYISPFLCRFTAREEMAERMAAFQPKKNEVFQNDLFLEINICSSCPEGFIWLSRPSWQEI